MKVTKMNIALFILLLAVFAVIGTQYQAVYGSSTGVYQIDKTTYDAKIGDIITVTGRVWIVDAGTYKLGYMSPNYAFFDNVISKTFSQQTGAYWAWSVNIPVTHTGNYEFYVHLPSGNQAMGSKSITVSAPIVTPPPTTNTCAGVTCGNYCSGTTLYKSGVCSNGQCNYQTVINSVECGYVPPVTVGSLYVDAVPDGILTLDGTIRGETPLTISSLSIGSHAVSIQKEGYKEFTATVNVNAGANAVVYTLIADDVPGTASSSDTMTTIMLIMILFVVLLGIVYWQVKR